MEIDSITVSPELIANGFSSRVVPPTNPVKGLPLCIAEAPGATEDKTGIVLHPEAEAGGLFTRLLARVGIARERMTLTNCVWSKPPHNELYDKDGNRQPYTTEALEYWKPFLHELIEELRPPVIIGLGRTALEVLTGFADIGTTRGYVNLARITLPKYNARFDDFDWEAQELNIPTLCTYHPQFLNYGNRHLSGVFIRDVLEGLEIGEKGWHPPKLNVTPNPTVEQFRWFCELYNPERHALTYDIETPDSSDLPEDELTDNGKEISGEIIRASFCFDTEVGGYSIPWTDPYIGLARELLGGARVVVSWNGRLFDRPRLLRYNCPVQGREYDLLDRWHHLHRTLPASLAFVAPFYLQISPWKHESHTQPEYYSAMDAIVTHLVEEGTERDLRATGQWDMYERHVVDVLALTEKMAQNGLPFDAVRAKEFEKELEEKQRERLGRLQELVPQELCPVKQKQGLKRVPKDTTGCVQRQFRAIYKDLSKEEKAAFSPELFDDLTDVLITRWALLEPFNPSSHPQVKALIRFFGHKAKTDRKTKKETSDDNTLKSLITSHLDSTKPSDAVAVECYQIIRECRAISKVLGTYVKGWRPGPDGLIHATPGIWGDMFRISWRKPNLAATVADKKEIQIASGFRKCIASSKGEVLVECDWKGMEAQLVAYFAGDVEYGRVSKMSINAYLASHILGRPADLGWSDGDLRAYLKEIRDDPANVKVYDDAKHTNFLITYGGTAFLMAEMYEMTRKRAQWLMDLFFSLFPKVKQWQQKVVDEAWEKCRLVNAWGYRMPIWDAYTWKQSRYERLRKLWVRYSTDPYTTKLSKQERKELDRILAARNGRPDSDAAITSLCYDLGGEAKMALSFYPRDTGAAMLKDVLLAGEDKYALVSKGFMRSLTHDAVLSLCPYEKAEEVAEQVVGLQERPQGRLNGLVIESEAKFGFCWDKSAMRSKLRYLPQPQVVMA